MRNILIISSLALNVFFAGFLAGGHFFGDGEGPDTRDADGNAHVRMIKMRGSDYLIPHGAFDGLPDDLRKEARSNLREGLHEGRKMYAEIKLKRDEVSGLLREPSLDRVAIGKALDELHEVQEKSQRRAADAFVDVLAGLPDEERISLLARVDAERSQRHERRRQYWQERKERYKYDHNHDEKEEKHQ